MTGGVRTARSVAAFAAAAAALALTGCFPRYDWRDHRPDCARTWCGFVATFPGRVTSATREIPVGDRRLPLALNVVSVGDVTFAVGGFELLPGSDPAAARALLERKLLDDVGAVDARVEARYGAVTLHAADRAEIAGETFEVEGRRDGKAMRATARFAERRGRLVEILVIGPADALSTGSGRQAVDTFMTSLRLD